jgi:hypothetical protein
VVPADAVAVAVPAGRDDRQFGVSELGSPRDGQRPPVDRVEAVGLEVARELARAADTRDEQDLLRVLAELRGGSFQRLEDAEVTTARTPGRLRLDSRRELVAFDLPVLPDG